MTEGQRQIMEVYAETGSYGETARILSHDRRYVARTVRKLTRTSAPVCEDELMVKSTVQYGPDGEVEREWRRLVPDAKALTALTDGLVERADGKGRAPKRRERKTDSAEMLLELVVSDPHIGMYAWADATGDRNYDTQSAKEVVLDAVDNITSRCRPAEALIVFNGDIVHCDNRNNMTERSGNILDVDGRYQRVVDYAVDTLTESVNMAAERSGKVNVLVIPGNHDWHTAVCLSRVLQAYYRKCGNVEVIVNNRPRHVFSWGRVLLGHAHGDRIKATDWAKIIPAEYPRQWAATRYRYMHLGHIHKGKSFAPVTVDNEIGLHVEFLKALCPIDQWHAESGYVGTIRGADGFLFSRTKGLDTRWSFNA